MLTYYLHARMRRYVLLKNRFHTFRFVMK